MKVYVAIEAKLEIMHKTAELAAVPQDDEHDPIADLDEDEEKLKNSEIIVENDT